MISLKRVVLALCVVVVRCEIEQNVTESICTNIVNVSVYDIEVFKYTDVWNYCAIDSEICKSCYNMVHQVRTSLTRKFDVIDFIKICNAYGGETLSILCDHIAQRCLPEFVGLLDSNMTSRDICSLTQTVPEDTLATRVCLRLVADVKTFLLSKSVRTTVTNVFNMICELIFIKDLRQVCLRAIEHRYQLFHEKVNATGTLYCDAFNNFNVGTIQVTDMKHVPEWIHFMLKPLKSASLCYVCKAIMNFVQMGMENKILQHGIEALLNAICVVVSPISVGLCQYYTSSAIEVVMTFIAQGADAARICPFVRMCTADQVSTDDDFEISSFKDIDTSDNSYADDMNKIFELLCDQLPSEKKYGCNQHLQNIKQSVH